MKRVGKNKKWTGLAQITLAITVSSTSRRCDDIKITTATTMTAATERRALHDVKKVGYCMNASSVQVWVNLIIKTWLETTQSSFESFKSRKRRELDTRLFLEWILDQIANPIKEFANIFDKLKVGKKWIYYFQQKFETAWSKGYSSEKLVHNSKCKCLQKVGLFYYCDISKFWR